MTTEAVQQEQQAEETEQTNATPETEGAEGTATEQVAKNEEELPAQTRIRELVADKLRLEALLERAVTPKQVQESASADAATDPEPQEEKFESYLEYTRAVARWSARQEIKTAMESERKAATDRTARESEEKTRDAFRARVKEARATIPEIDAILTDQTLPVSPAMASTITQLDNGPQILYALHKDRAEAARIAALPPALSAVAIGKLSARLETEKSVSRTPPPPNTLGGGGSSGGEPDPSKDMAAWMRWRKKQG